MTRVGRVVEHVPRPSPYLVARPRLLGRLDIGSPLTVLRAPVGFGKTTLAAQWVADQERSTRVVAWIRVRPGTTDAMTFWADALAVLADAGLRSRRLLPATPQGLASELERVITAADEPVVLVLDSFENIAVPHLDRAILDVLRYAPHLRLIAAGRGQRHFAAHSYIDLEATVITASDLLFTADETRQLLETIGVRLPPTCSTRIHAASGGWPEPLRAFALVARDVPAIEADLFDAAQRVAIDYLRRHLASDADATDHLDFALATSVPDDFSSDLAELLAADQTAKSHIDWLVQQALLIAHRGGGGTIYRWPDAARQALLAELQGRDPGRVSDLHAKAGSWYLGNGQPGRALDHALRSEDWQLVVRVVESSWRELVFAHPERLFDALATAPLDVVATSARALALRDARLRVPDDRFLNITTLPAAAEHVPQLTSNGEAADLLDTGYTVLTAMRRRGLFDRAGIYGDHLLEIAVHLRNVRPADVTAHYPAIELGVGVTRMVLGDVGSALEPLRRAHEFAPDDAYTASNAAAKLALSHAFLGSLRNATRWLERHTAAPLAETWLAPRTRLPSTAARWLIAIDRLERTEATRIHEDWPGIGRDDELWAYFQYVHAQHALNAGTPSGMLNELGRARSMYRSWLGHGAGAAALLESAEVDLLLALGLGNPARAVLSGPRARHPLLQVGHARLALLAGHNDAALRLANDTNWHRNAIERHRLEMQVIRAVAAYRSGDLADAVDALGRAADTARQTGALRAFVTVPREELRAIAVHLPSADELLLRPAIVQQHDVFPPRVTVITLTEREQRVLEKLAAGLTTRQTADSLVVSVNTVKTQQASLYRKLGVNSRVEAVARARQWGLGPAAHTSADIRDDGSHRRNSAR
jgi:LuxR family maltose regulon positive regulatory protein